MGEKEIEAGGLPKRFGTIELLEMHGDRIVLRSPAKVNLFLRVLGIRDDGYHEVETVMQAISIWDEVEIEVGGDGIEVLCSDPMVPRNEGNIAWRAAKGFAEEFGIGNGIRAVIRKGIPVGAGLGGGSGNAAAMLVGMNLLFGIGAPRDKLFTLGRAIGCDVPFFFSSGTAQGKGRGDEIEDLPPLDIWMVLIHPGYSLSTALVYKSFRGREGGGCVGLDLFVEAMRGGSIRRISELVYNSLEDTVVSLCPEVGLLKDFLVEAGAMCASVSGSGPAVFGIVDGKDHAFEVMERVRERGISNVYVVRNI
jgi:4-diphosphocytidyl-2-C-methyl-D-erythritol kinase